MKGLFKSTLFAFSFFITSFFLCGAKSVKNNTVVSVLEEADKLVTEGSVAEKESFSVPFVGHGLMQQVLHESSNFITSISHRLDSVETFESALLDVAILLEHYRETKEDLFKTFIKQLLKKAERKSMNKQFVHFKPYIAELQKMFIGREDAGLPDAMHLSFYPDFQILDSHISQNLKKQDTFLEALKDLYLILEHDLVGTSADARAKIIKRIRKALTQAAWYDHNEGFDKHILEIIDKALDMKTAQDIFVWPEDKGRHDLVRIKEKMTSKKSEVQIRSSEQEQSAENTGALEPEVAKDRSVDPTRRKKFAPLKNLKDQHEILSRLDTKPTLKKSGKKAKPSQQQPAPYRGARASKITEPVLRDTATETLKKKRKQKLEAEAAEKSEEKPKKKRVRKKKEVIVSGPSVGSSQIIIAEPKVSTSTTSTSTPVTSQSSLAGLDLTLGSSTKPTAQVEHAANHVVFSQSGIYRRSS